jgi:O-acetyl-ADP-ribose deacetylase (regulator of RNase III)
MYSVGQHILEAAGKNLTEDIDELDIIAETTWGPAKIAMGGAELLGPSSYSSLSARYVVLAVPPLSLLSDESDFDSGADEDMLHYMETTLRTSYRSAFRSIKKSGMDAVGIPTISTKEGGKLYERTLQIGLETLVEEAKTSKLNNLHFLAASKKEARILIKLAVASGFVWGLKRD